MALIVAVDDDRDITEMLTAVLNLDGHTVRTADDGPTALSLIGEARPDLAILDHHMPGMTGLQLAQLLRSDAVTRDLPLLMLSAAAPPAALLSCTMVLAKPTPMKQLRAVVGSMTTEPADVDAVADKGRIRAVSAALGVHTTAVAQRLDALCTQLAAATGAQMAAVNLMLTDAVAVCGSHGLDAWIVDAGGLPAEWAPCRTVVRGNTPVLIGDTRAVPANTGNPLVQVSGIRSYAGVPLVDSAGQILGTVCVMHRRPHAFTNNTLGILGARAHQALDGFRL